MGKQKLFAEINNKKIRYAVFEFKDEKDYNLIIKKDSNNIGIKNGSVEDINLATDIVSKDLKEIEKKLDKVFDKINLIINQKEIISTNLTSFKNLNGAKVEKRDLDYILNEGKISISKNEKSNSILHILNSNFYLDKKKREKIPLNIFGDHLGLQMTFVSLPKNNIKNINNLFENNDLIVDRLFCKQLITGVNLTTGNNNLKNFFLLNIDEELSSVSVYENSCLVFFKNFSFGTNSIYRDLSQLCSIKYEDVVSMLKELNFEKKFENDQQYIDRKFFKESEFTKLSLSHIKNIIDARIQEMMNYLFNKNTNIDYFKNRLSHFYIVFENKIFNENFGTIFKNHLNINSEKTIFKQIPLNDLSFYGAAELAFKGWHAEAVPYTNEKKSIFSGVFSRLFK